MTQADIKRLALILSIQAEIEAMKVYNATHPDNIGYGEDQFWNKAQELNELAHKHDDQL